jgi:hypothetical protein
MAKKNICSIPLDWTIQDYSRHTCTDGSHHHLSHSQVHFHEKNDLVIWLRKSETRRENSVVQVQILPALSRAPVTGSLCAPRSMNTGLSFRVGEELARSLGLKHEWAQVMYSHITMRPAETPNV